MAYRWMVTADVAMNKFMLFDAADYLDGEDTVAERIAVAAEGEILMCF
jgi:hypothetical protein